MRVAIIGPGAMGCLFAVRLARSGIQVTLVDYRPDRARRMKAIRVKTSDEIIEAACPVVTHVPEAQDLIIVLTKAHATASLTLPAGVSVLTLQNGLGNAETLAAKVGADYVLAGSTYEAATLQEEGLVLQAASGVTTLGPLTSCSTDSTVAALRGAGFTVEITDDIHQTLWRKVLVNAGVNPLTALLDVKNGRLLEIPEANALLEDLVLEAAAVARAEGVPIDYDAPARTRYMCRQTSENLSSMLQDVRARRRTEIDAISGEIVRRGERSGVATPCTRVLWRLIRSLEQR
jgi:2-dehydropantoate 2-reductase